jgi:hypothetical protein
MPEAQYEFRSNRRRESTNVVSYREFVMGWSYLLAIYEFPGANGTAKSQ